MEIVFKKLIWISVSCVIYEKPVESYEDGASAGRDTG